MMKTIVVGNLKGGVGKSTTVINLAYIFAEMGKRVLIIDADPQCNATSIYAKVNGYGRTLQDVVSEKKSVTACVYRTRYENIDIIKGNPYMTEDDVRDMSWFTRIRDGIGGIYDVCLVDTRPTFGRLTESAIAGADIYLTPVCLDKFCKDNLAQVEEFIDAYVQEGMKWLVYANQCDFRRRGQKAIYKDLVEKHSYPFMDNCVSYSVPVQNALAVNKPVFKHRSKCTGSLDFIELAKELAEHMESGV